MQRLVRVPVLISCLLVATMLSVMFLPMMTQTSTLDNPVDDIQYSSPIQATISPSSGWTTGGEEITITGSGLLDMAYKNVTSDGVAYEWTKSTASYVTSSGWDPSIGVDSNGTVRIVSSNLESDDIWLSSYDGSTWTHDKIRDCDVCRKADLVIDSNDNIHVAYYHSISGTGYLLYSMYNGNDWINNWSTSNVENDQISLALDANDQPHISYSKDGFICNAAMLSYYDGSSWTTVTLDDTSTYVGCDSSIAIDSNGFVHVAYRHHGNMDMLIASNISGSWQRYTVHNGNNVGYHSAMAVDSNDGLHLVYASNNAGNTAYFADGASGSAWSVSNQGNSRDTFSMYIDQYDIVHISEYNGDSNLGYSMVAPGASRQSMTVDNVGDVGYGNDIVVDDNNMVHIAYYDSTNKNLMYANRSTGLSLTQEVTIQFGSYGNVTATVVNDTTILVTTPMAGQTADTVDLTVRDKDGNEHVIASVFTYISPDDVDMDGVLTANDDCPNIAGNSSQDVNGCPDADGDGYSNSGDAFPSDVSEWMDSDGDGVGDNSDSFPNDANESMDSDGDGVGDNSDAFPNDANESMDSDGDGVGDNSDAFPVNGMEQFDADGDGVGDNADAFPNDANESLDTDGDGVGDNADAFPDDANESTDSDGDGIGDNSDEYPFIDNSIDADSDGYLDLADAFPNDATQWMDSDSDGYGDNASGNNPDQFTNVSTQWADTDGDGYGDNWGNSSWNSSRLFVWPGQYVESAELADHCPTVSGNSTADGIFGCPDGDGDGIADQYDDVNGSAVIEEEPEEEPEQETQDESNSEEESYLDSLFSGNTETITQTAGFGAILLAVLALLQTNLVAGLLPDAFRWVQVLRRSNKLSKEEIKELTYLQSLVQAYYLDIMSLNEELELLKGDLTARYMNNEIKKDTREKLITLVDELQSSTPNQIETIAFNDAYFGLIGTTDSEERTELLEQELAMRNDQSVPVTVPAVNTHPDVSIIGKISSEDGHEYLEYPAGSGVWYHRNQTTNQWDKWE